VSGWEEEGLRISEIFPSENSQHLHVSSTKFVASFINIRVRWSEMKKISYMKATVNSKLLTLQIDVKVEVDMKVKLSQCQNQSF
jgi:hypothetical protein